MSALSLFKSTSEIVVSLGVGAIVGNAIKATTPVPTAVKSIRGIRTFNRASVAVGGFVISGMLGDMAAKYAVNKIDDAAKQISEAKAAIDEAVTRAVEDES